MILLVVVLGIGTSSLSSGLSRCPFLTSIFRIYCLTISMTVSDPFCIGCSKILLISATNSWLLSGMDPLAPQHPSQWQQHWLNHPCIQLIFSCYCRRIPSLTPSLNYKFKSLRFEPINYLAVISLSRHTSNKRIICNIFVVLFFRLIQMIHHSCKHNLNLKHKIIYISRLTCP